MLVCLLRLMSSGTSTACIRLRLRGAALPSVGLPPLAGSVCSALAIIRVERRALAKGTGSDIRPEPGADIPQELVAGIPWGLGADLLQALVAVRLRSGCV